MKKNIYTTLDEKGIAELRMEDTEGKNIFNDAFIHGFLEALDELEGKKDGIKALILKGMPDIFCGGAEKQTLLDLCDGKIVVKDLIMSERLISVPFPVIAAMEGHAVGGGFVLGLCCDIVLAARESRYGAVFMNMGFTPGMGTTTLLKELVGPFIAKEMMFTGKRFKGSELEKKGIPINYILPRVEVYPKARDIALQISEKNIKSLQILKYTLSGDKRKMLVDARVQEDLMHTITFGLPETKKIIEDTYVE